MQVKLERLYRLDADTDLKAFADIMLDDAIVIKGLRVVQGKQGLRVGMPCDLGKDGKWYDQVIIINEDIKKNITDMILTAYEG